MVETLVLETRGAMAARLAVGGAVGAMYVLSRGLRQCQLGHASLAVNEQRMRKPVLVNHAPDAAGSRFVSNDVAEFHDYKDN